MNTRDDGAPNRRLYREGRAFTRELGAKGTVCLSQNLLRPVAVRHGTSVAEVRTAIEFATHVDQVSDVVGRAAKEVLLSGENPLLTPVLICQLARLSPSRMRGAVERAVGGFHPFSASIPEHVAPRRAVWWHDLTRLDAACRLISPATSEYAKIDPEERPTIFRDATAVRMAAAALRFRLQKSGAEGPHFDHLRPALQLGNGLRKRVKRARSLTEAVCHDLPLLLSENHIYGDVRQDFLSRVESLHAAASFIAEATRQSSAVRRTGPSILSERPEGPDGRPGTYIVVMRLKQSAVVRIGRLEAFWLPAGYLLYVGSAMGGVKSRTDRHLRSDVPKMWNLDHIKAVTSSSELWWSHSTNKVECHWAMALAELPSYRCPAPGFGSNDCKSCPAHFFHTSAPPSAEAFAGVVRAVPDHPTIYRMRLNSAR